MKTKILSTLFALALIAAAKVSAADATNAPVSNTAPAAVVATNAPVASSDQTPQPADQPPPAATPATNSYGSIITLPNGQKGVVMNFRGVPLEEVLNFMSDAAGLAINPNNRVDVSGKVNLWSVKPVTKEDAVKMLIQMLQDNGYAAILNDRMLTIMRADDAAKSNNQVQKGNDPEKIPKTPNIVTQIIPVNTLNVVQLVKNLQSLLGPNATISADESANSIVLTDTQANVHHIVEIIAALDSVSSGNATIEVFPLKFGDSKAVADLIKNLFQPDQNGSGNGNTRSPFGRFRGGGFMGALMGGGAAGSDNSGGDGSSGHTPTAKVSAVNDDHANAVIVSAPDGLMPTIEHLVKELDVPVEDATVARIFQLHNADPVEMANTITSLFPDDTNQNDASRNTFGFRGFPGFGGFGTPQRSGSDTSDRMKKMSRVIAVADPRTQQIIITAGTNVMDQIELIVQKLDESDARKIKPFYISLQNADPADVLPILQGLFPPMTGMSTSTSTYNSSQNPFTQRQTTLLQNQNSSAATSTSTFNSGRLGGGAN